MKVFVTGGTGLVGTAVIPQLVNAGHTVTALARSSKSADLIKSMGATPVHGTHTDLEVLAEASRAVNAVFHLAFNHELAFQDGGMVTACEEDRAAISAMCDALLSSGIGEVFVNSSGVLGSTGPDETCGKEPKSPFPRGESEVLTHSYAKKGLRTINLRLPPVVHGPGYEHPFILTQINAAKSNGVTRYIGDGQQLWASVHVKDAAALYVLALKAPAGVNLHAVQEEGISVKEISGFIAKHLGLETKSTSVPEAMGAGYGFIAVIMSLGNRTTANLTRKWTGWEPKEYGLFEELTTYPSMSRSTS